LEKFEEGTTMNSNIRNRNSLRRDDTDDHEHANATKRLMKRVLVGLALPFSLALSTAQAQVKHGPAITQQRSAPSPEPRNAYVNDPVELRRHVEEQDKKVVAAQKILLAELEAAISRIDGKTLRGEIATVDALRKVARELTSEAWRVTRIQSNYLSEMKDYVADLEPTSKALLAHSQAFNKFAEQEKYDDLKEQYRLLAKVFEKLSERMIQRRATLLQEKELVDENYSYVYQTHELLTRLARALESVPDLTAGSSVEEWLNDLEQYIQHFEKMKQLIGNFHDALQVRVNGPVKPQNDASNVKVVSHSTPQKEGTPN
jgi:hypothetical protein